MPRARYEQVNPETTPWYHVVSRFVRREYLCHARMDLVTGFGSQDLRTFVQRFDRQDQGLGVRFRVSGTECPRRLLQDLGKIQLGLVGKPNRPCVTHAPPMALDATADRWSLSDSWDSWAVKRPCSMSVTPTLTALRSASRRDASSASRCSTRRTPSRKTSLAFW